MKYWGIRATHYAVAAIIVVELLAIFGFLPFPHELTVYWPVYLLISYFLLFELPWRLLRDQPMARHYFSLAGFFVVLNLASDGIGMLFSFFDRFWWYDVLMHSTFFPWRVAAIALAVGKGLKSKFHLHHAAFFVPLVTFFCAFSMLSFHEIMEYLIDLVSGSNAGTGIQPCDIYDTSQDLLCDFTGVIIFCAFYFGWEKYKKKKVY